MNKRAKYIYVASSWRNRYQPGVIGLLKFRGFECYDFRNPGPGKKGFAWSDIDPNWQEWTVDQYNSALEHPIAKRGFKNDFDAMKRADTFVLILPSGRSAHLELGWAAGAGKRTAILMPEKNEPELMNKMADEIFTGLLDLVVWLEGDKDSLRNQTLFEADELEVI